MLKIEDFLSVGYREYPINHFKTEAKCLLQKTVRDRNDPDIKRYFINVYVYDLSRFSPELGMSFCPGVTFFTEDHRQVDVEYHDFKDIESLESFYENMYSYLGSVPDIHNN